MDEMRLKKLAALGDEDAAAHLDRKTARARIGLRVRSAYRHDGGPIHRGEWMEPERAQWCYVALAQHSISGAEVWVEEEGRERTFFFEAIVRTIEKYGGLIMLCERHGLNREQAEAVVVGCRGDAIQVIDTMLAIERGWDWHSDGIISMDTSRGENIQWSDETIDYRGAMMERLMEAEGEIVRATRQPTTRTSKGPPQRKQTVRTAPRR